MKCKNLTLSIFSIKNDNLYNKKEISILVVTQHEVLIFII
jgi:hypothetical protein